PTWSAPSISIAGHVVSITLDGGADRGNPRSPTRPPCCVYRPCSQAFEPVSSGAEPVGLARHSPAPAAWAPVRAGHAEAHLSVRLVGAADVAVGGSFPSGGWLLGSLAAVVGLACIRMPRAGVAGPS